MILDGKKLSSLILSDLEKKTKSLKRKYKIKASLRVILVGKDPSSQIYVGKKIELAQKLGIDSKIEKLPKNVSQKRLEAKIRELNKSEKVHGILLQLPLSSHLSTKSSLKLIHPLKDVDALSPYHVYNLAHKNPVVCPCTPSGILKLLDHYKISLSGKKSVVVGRSLIVGRPLAQMLLNRSSTVSICHSKTKNLKSYFDQADLIFISVGKREFFKKSHFKKKHIVIDVGVHSYKGKIKGDVSSQVKAYVKAISPTPGGVGPMTLACLMENTLKLFEMQMKEK